MNNRIRATMNEFKLHVKSLRVMHRREFNDYDNNYYDNDIYIFNCVDEMSYSKEKYEVILYETIQSCPSGYCESTLGFGYVRRVIEFATFNYLPKSSILTIPILFKGDKSKLYSGDLIDLENTVTLDENDVYELDDDGGDEYYPTGYIKVNLDLFKKTSRYKDKRPVWIFKGPSGLGKSFLAHVMTAYHSFNEHYCDVFFGHFSVYETDAHEELGDINDDIIVIGNKYIHSVDAVLRHIQGDVEPIIVDFSKY